MGGSALDSVLGDLACPLCGAALARAGSALRCAEGHAYDVARQGYVTLRSGASAGTGDSAAMVAAREAFLTRGHYAPIAGALTEAVGAALGVVVGAPAAPAAPAPAAPAPGAGARATSPATDPAAPPVTAPGTGSRAAAHEAGPLCVDLAGGTGHYTRAVLEAHPGVRGVCLDVSAPALRRAARAHERLAAVGADVWRPLPLRDDAAACVLSVFGPRNVAEIVRVLTPGGRLVVVTPTPRHLHELAGPLGMIGVDPRKDERLATQLEGLTLAARQPLEYEVAMSRADACDAVLMGPSAHHVEEAALRALVDALPEPVRVTVSVTLTAWTTGPTPGPDPRTRLAP
ncbi:putative RNA methyltransferase [Georgenia wangjunii]|uniref:putative RNA methyltransferase n=1 Tax=Georgenia wangjunii TaxID=3117730 RepID=UPI002F262A60